MLKSGPKNLISDVAGLIVGHADEAKLKSGTTVLTAATPFLAAVDVMGGAPGTRETDCLAPGCLVEDVDALVLSGGSAFGLDAASGVANALHRQGRGFSVGPATVPIVPAAILFDLLNGGEKDWQFNPYARLGEQALAVAAAEFELGNVGAGAGCTTADLKGGLGSASTVLPDGSVVGALVAVNAHGSAVVPGSRHFHAASEEFAAEFGGLGPAGADALDAQALPRNRKQEAWLAQANTTIGIIATDVKLDKAGAKRFATAAQDGFARALKPSHTLFDGDLIFAVSTRQREMRDAAVEQVLLGHVAALTMARAIARGVYHATAQQGDILPVWGSLECAPRSRKSPRDE